MDFSLSKEHKLLQEMYRKFAENEVKPLAQEIDEEERFPRENIGKLARYGFLVFLIQRSMKDRAEIILLT